MKTLLLWIAFSVVTALLFEADSLAEKKWRWLRIVISPIVWPEYLVSIVFDHIVLWTKITAIAWFMACCGYLLVYTMGMPITFSAILASIFMVFIVIFFWLCGALMFEGIIVAITRSEWDDVFDS